MLLGDYLLILRPLPLVFYIIGVSAIETVNTTVMTEWFDHAITGYGKSEQVWDPKDEAAVFDWNNLWREPELSKYLRTLPDYKALPAKKMKNFIQAFGYFTEDADQLMLDIDAGTWFNCGENEKDRMLQDIEKYWKKCIRMYWPEGEDECGTE